MKILVVDDEAYRHEGFDKSLRGHEVWHAYDAPRAERLLDEHAFDMVCIDHDLGEPQLCGTGQDVARKIVSMPEGRRPPRALIHSWNFAGARAIQGILAGHVQKMWRQPFQWPGDDDPIEDWT